MKRFILTISIITLIFEILMFPKDAAYYATIGLKLWFDTMIPALFPFMVISSLIIRLDIAPLIISFLHPFLNLLFKTNHYCEYAIMLGFLCGYPMGAVIIRDLIKENKITTMQAEYLLAFCNNIGPVFFFSIVLPIFRPEIHIFLFIGMYIIPFLYGIILRYTVYKKAFENTKKIRIPKETENKSFSSAFTDAINQAVSSVLFLGACMIFFNMLRFLPVKFFSDNIILQTFFCWLLEINGAITATAKIYSDGLAFPALFMIPLMQIGGLSCIMQTTGILSNCDCNILKHFLHKCIQALFWLFLMLFVLFIFPE